VAVALIRCEDCGREVFRPGPYVSTLESMEGWGLCCVIQLSTSYIGDTIA